MENYRPQLFLRTADITVSLHWPEGTPDAAEKMVMPGDNVEMVCDLVHDAAAEVGTRFTLREGGKTSKRFYPVFLTHDPHGHSQLEPVLLQRSSRQLKPFASCWSPQSIPQAIRMRVRYKSCCCLSPLMLSSPVICHSPLMKSRNIASDAYVHIYITTNPSRLRFACNGNPSNPRICLSLVLVKLWLLVHQQFIWCHLRPEQGPFI